MEKKLHLGCSYKKLKGFVNVDFNKECNPDIAHDLNKFPYPFKDNEFDYILMHHVLEHLDDTVKVLDELHRILKKGGVVEIHVPHFACNTAMTHITHKKAFSTRTFDIFDSKIEKYSPKKFKVIYKKLIWTNSKNIFLRIIGKIIDTLSNANFLFYERMWCYLVGGSYEIQFKLKAIK